MKRFIFFMLILGFSMSAAQAQRNMRFGYIDMEYILENVKDYQEVTQLLDARVERWKVELETKTSEIEKMRINLSNERALLTHELIEEREDEIRFKEQEITQLQQERFGPNGSYFEQKKRLIRPIQDQVYTIVQEIAQSRQYDFIFDKTGESSMLFAAERHDISDLVIRRLDREANREEATSRGERREIERIENLTDEQSRAVHERDRAREQARREREQIAEQRIRERDSIRAARVKEVEDRRQEILEERNNRRQEAQEQERQAREEEQAKRVSEREADLEKRIKERDSLRELRQRELEDRRTKLIEERQRRIDSITKARENRNK